MILPLLSRLLGVTAPDPRTTETAAPLPEPRPITVAPPPTPPVWDGTWRKATSTLADEIAAAHKAQQADVVQPEPDADPDVMVAPWVTPEATS